MKNLNGGIQNNLKLLHCFLGVVILIRGIIKDLVVVLVVVFINGGSCRAKACLAMSIQLVNIWTSYLKVQVSVWTKVVRWGFDMSNFVMGNGERGGLWIWSPLVVVLQLIGRLLKMIMVGCFLPHAMGMILLL